MIRESKLKRRNVMRRIVEEETEGEFDAMLGKSICLLCMNYIYTGILKGVNETHVELDDPKLVYETGNWNDSEWKHAQSLSSPWRVRIDSVESWGAGK
jgi:hypothetical protein